MQSENFNDMVNPILQYWQTPFETPPFHLIRTDHFEPAAKEAIKLARKEIKAITENPDSPTFENTVAALDLTGENLGRVAAILFNLNSAETSSELQAVARKVSPMLTRFSNEITLNEKLFARIKEIHDSRSLALLNSEEQMLVERKFRNFLLGGAGLKDQKKNRFRKITLELARLSLRFEENVLRETNSFELHITDSSDLAGLPESIIEMASADAKQRKSDGWIFTLHYPSYMPFMQYSEKRHLREKLLKAYSSRSFNANKNDNRTLVRRIANLRLEIANLLGFRSFAEMTLGDRMAENPDRVESFINELYHESHPAALRDHQNLEKFARANGHQDRVERWDWAYFSEKLKKAKYDIDDEILKPYFSLESVTKAIFDLASRLYGIKFTENNDIPLYHPEVKTFEISDTDGSFLAILYLDFHSRPGKNNGAWMTCFREQRWRNSKEIRPLVSIVTNFTRATESRPSLLTFNELTTFLHEFGHALHAVFSKCKYESLSGTNVARDFVELPSQIMENWAFEQQWLDEWASHYQTGQKIPKEMIIKIKEASTFNEGYAFDRQLGFCFLDMAWHNITSPVSTDITEFESKAMEKTELLPRIDSSSISCSFTHLFGGEYAAGYYGYKWAEVLDADAFSHFKENGVFNTEIASSFRKNILEKGGTDKPLNLYINFRGKKPSLDALLERSGLR
jgi:peptidyl-dipeptidase Dcp